ncbi:hypothetical protein [Uliginosibacterium sediminicola]|uniref:Uncharacterized protein n=1 Tax=Uliginosibacterium sediminicola TaxID=2024550 RepID=A0ABU9YWA6_9RHOO
MSLFNDVSARLASEATAASLSSSGARGALSLALGSAADAVVSTVGGGVLGTLARGGTTMAQNAIANTVDGFIPPGSLAALDVGSRALGDVLSGNFSGAGQRLMESGFLDAVVPGLRGIAIQERYWKTPTPMFGGLTPAEARAMFMDTVGVRRAKKNLWILEVSSNVLGSDQPELRFNLLASEVEYAPNTITGDRRRIGGVVSEALQSSEPVEMRITTFDDEQGSLKKWFDAHAKRTVHQDGTFGVPGGSNGYAIKIKIVHGTNSTAKMGGAYYDAGYFRTANEEISLSRREDAFQELQLTFAQLDTFMKV